MCIRDRCGTLEEILSLLEIAGCAVVQLVATISTIDQTGEQACFSGLASAVTILSQHLNLFKDIFRDDCFVSIVKDGLIFYRIISLFLVPDRIGESLEVDGTAGILSALQNISVCCLVPFAWILRCV